MQLKIKREERKSGLIKKKVWYVIETQLVCTEEERAAIKVLGIEDHLFYEPYEWNTVEQNTPIKYWADKGTGVVSDTLIHSQALEAEIKENAKRVKDAVTNFLAEGGSAEKEEVIDL